MKLKQRLQDYPAKTEVVAGFALAAIVLIYAPQENKNTCLIGSYFSGLAGFWLWRKCWLRDYFALTPQEVGGFTLGTLTATAPVSAYVAVKGYAKSFFSIDTIDSLKDTDNNVDVLKEFKI